MRCQARRKLGLEAILRLVAVPELIPQLCAIHTGDVHDQVRGEGGKVLACPNAYVALI